MAAVGSLDSAGIELPTAPAEVGEQTRTCLPSREESASQVRATDVVWVVSQGYYFRTLILSGILSGVEKAGLCSTLLCPETAQSFAAKQLRQLSVSPRILPLSAFPQTGLVQSKLWWSLGERFDRLNWRMGRALVALAYEKSIKAPHYADLLRELNPWLVVSASPGCHVPDDVPVLVEAKRLGIPTLAIIHSWDNLQTKRMRCRPHYLAVWNDLMRDEAWSMHLFPKERVFVIGAPQMDIYFKPDLISSRSEFFSQMYLDPSKKLVVFATAPARSVIDHRYVLDVLVEALRNNRFAEPVQLLCRVHPQEDRNHYYAYRAIPGVKFDFPGRYIENWWWTPDHEETRHLANTLHHADVVVNVASTITVECALLDTPVVCVGFPPPDDPERMFERNIIKGHYHRHFKYVIESGAARMATSPADLITAVNEYLADQSRDQDRRKLLAHRILHKLDGRAAERAAALIVQLCGERTSAPR